MYLFTQAPEQGNIAQELAVSAMRCRRLAHHRLLRRIGMWAGWTGNMEESFPHSFLRYVRVGCLHLQSLCVRRQSWHVTPLKAGQSSGHALAVFVPCLTEGSHRVASLETKASSRSPYSVSGPEPGPVPARTHSPTFLERRPLGGIGKGPPEILVGFRIPSCMQAIDARDRRMHHWVTPCCSCGPPSPFSRLTTNTTTTTPNGRRER